MDDLGVVLFQERIWINLSRTFINRLGSMKSRTVEKRFSQVKCWSLAHPGKMPMGMVPVLHMSTVCPPGMVKHPILEILRSQTEILWFFSHDSIVTFPYWVGSIFRSVIVHHLLPFFSIFPQSFSLIFTWFHHFHPVFTTFSPPRSDPSIARSSNVWTLDARLVSSDIAAGDRFGNAVKAAGAVFFSERGRGRGS